MGRSQRNPSQDLPTATAGRADALGGDKLPEKPPVTPLPDTEVRQPCKPEDDNHRPSPPPPIPDTLANPCDQAVPPGELAILPAVIPSAPMNNPLVPGEDGIDYLASLRTSYDPTDPPQRHAALRACLGEDIKIEDHIGREIHIEHWAQHPAAKTDQVTGEVSRFVRTVLVSPNGIRYSTGSDPICRALAQLTAFFGRAPWRPPIKVQILERGPKDRRWYLLDPLP